MKQSDRRSLLRMVFILAWPAMVEQALQTVVMYADSAMVGRLGVQATASVGLTSTVTWLVNSPMWAIGGGILAVIARAVGARDETRVHRTAQQAIWLALITGIILMLFTEIAAPYLPTWLHADAEIRRDGSLYFMIVCAPMIFRSFSMMMGSALRAAGDTRTPMLVNLQMNLINIVLNFFFIFPTRSVSLFGLSIPIWGAGWGVIGAAVASAISYIYCGVFMFVKVLKSPVLAPLSEKLAWNRPIMKDCLKIGLPLALQNLGVFSGHVLFSAQITALGKTALATHSIALTAEEAFYIPGYGMQTAASTLAGNALGAKDRKRLEDVSRMILFLSMGMMLISGLILFIFPAPLMRVFTQDAAVITGGSRVLRIVAVSEPLYAAQIIFEGVFRGVGQTKYSFVVGLSTMWGVRILGTCICLNCFGLGLEAAWFCMVGDNVSRAILLGLRYFGNRWKAELELDS